MTTTTIAIAAGVVALIGLVAGWALRGVPARKREAELQRNVFEAKGSVPQLESALTNRRHQLERAELEIESGREREAELRSQIDDLTKQSQNLQREKRSITSELNALKNDGDGMFGLEDDDVSLGADDPSANGDAFAKLTKQYQTLRESLFERDEKIRSLEEQIANPEGRRPAESLEKKLLQAQAEIQSLNEALTEKSKAMTVLQEHAEAVEQEKEMLAGFARKRSQANQEARELASSFEERMEEARGKIDEQAEMLTARDASIKQYLSDADAARKTKALLEGTIDELHAAVENKDRTISSHQEVVDGLQERIARKAEAIQSIETKNRDLIDRLDDTQTRLSDRETAIVKQQSRIEQSRKELDDQKEVAQALTRTIEDRDFRIADYVKQIADLDAVLAKAREETQTVRGTLAGREEEVLDLRAEAEINAGRIEAMKRTNTDLGDQIDGLQSELNRTKDDLGARSAEIRAFKELGEHVDRMLDGYALELPNGSVGQTH